MKLIPLTQGKFAQVDDEDFEWLNQWKWFAGKMGNTFYARRNVTINGIQTAQLMHVLIMGEDSLKLHIDHKDGDGCNDQRLNLRRCTQSENCMNRKPRKNCASIYKGVCWHKSNRKWMAYIKIGERRIHLGCFNSDLDAAHAYDIACIKHHGEFARPNFPPTT